MARKATLRRSRKKAVDGQSAPGAPVTWGPEPEMVEALAVMQREQYRISASKLREAVGITDSTWRRWVNMPSFAAWWVKEAERWCMDQLPRVYGHLVGRATGDSDYKTGGSWQDAKLLLERFDNAYIPRNKAIIAAKMALGTARPADLELIDELLSAGLQAGLTDDE